MKNLLAIDLGSSKTTAIIANYDEITDNISISGVGIAKTRGVKKGAIVNIDQASRSIKQAYNDAKRVAGVDVKKAIVSISSVYTKSIISYGIVNIPGNEITIKEINRAIQTALYNANIPQDYQLLQALPYDFKVDELSEIEDPAGMSGSRLEVSLHIIAVQKSGVENLKKTLKQAGLEIENIVSAGYASGLATLKDDEKELGVALIDIGATTSDLAIFVNKSLRHTDYLGVGSHHITNDLSMALHTPLSDAEEIKIKFGEYVKNDDELIEISVIGNEEEKQKASITTITQVIIARIEETFMLLNKEIEESGLKNKIGAGIVLTGGFTNFYNIKEIASQFFDGLPVRVGIPKKIDGLFENLKAPEFSTPIGLLLYGTKEGLTYEIDSNRQFRTKSSFEEISKNIENNSQIIQKEEKNEPKEELSSIMINNEPSFWQKIKTWLSNLF
ncbi:cell division protein FtsA [Caminibacter mediatlanticus TB-2]|uniref:Cell division protein FtsA n=1 Tax=Caminibacter mediatlanticus TB-2 TaxID=391592 RepID=A0ABX5V8U7_9BACT|nr:cell division protein FtsA [Caminibacter mediatlanticus]QCT94693.1 cell division protein FtsA [Caminibacter mediatlanticus TB-2]